ncbi:hypothetical protein PP515_gp52 [Gordonia phage Sidious]|uniref:Uncharacterized protein n=1 Tax=Gordonia phage Sidious TaxID=2591118 RepID=A0A515MIB3_9CAUD|nr:hypothetical protein PP515_gp52 [Gordonia phage Sidious]QDM56399.1 hypothetical protein SEA_SIDIOUS_52 [Gordonia phage Sidious]
MTIHTTADLDLGDAVAGVLTSIAANRPATISPLDIDDGPGARIRFAVDLGAVADTAEVIVPFTALAEYVDQVRASTEPS